MLLVLVSAVSSIPGKQQGKEEIHKNGREQVQMEQVTSAKEQEERRVRKVFEEGQQVLGTVLDNLGKPWCQILSGFDGQNLQFSKHIFILFCVCFIKLHT
jgi:hypothetical protein